MIYKVVKRPIGFTLSEIPLLYLYRVITTYHVNIIEQCLYILRYHFRYMAASKSKSPKSKSPVEMIDEVKKSSETAPGEINLSLANVPNPVDMLADSIRNTYAQTAMNEALYMNKVSEGRLKSVNNPTAETNTPQPSPLLFGGFGRNNNGSSDRMLGILQMLPDEERAEFIKENKEALLGGTNGGDMSSALLKNMLLQKESNGNGNNNGGGGMGEMAQVLLAMNEMNQQNMQMFFTLQQQMAPQNNGDQTQILQTLMDQIKSVSSNSTAQVSALQEQVLAMQQENLRLQQEQLAKENQQFREQAAHQIQQLQEMVKQSQNTQGIQDKIEQLRKEGVNVQTESTEQMEIKNNYNLELEKMRREEARENRRFEIDAKRSDERTALLNTLGSLVSGAFDASRVKKVAESGGTKNAQNIAARMG